MRVPRQVPCLPRALGAARSLRAASLFVLTLTVGLHARAEPPPRRALLPDARVKVAVEAELLRRPVVEFDSLDVALDQGVVTLSGRVSNILARDEALDAAANVKGVRAVIDRMNVTARGESDAKVRADVMAALAADPVTDAHQIEAFVKDGVVELRGKAASWAEKHLATRVAKGVVGVKAVNNALAIQWDAPRTDAEIAADIRGLLDADANVNSNLVRVAVKDGVVVLSGEVGSALERGYAIENAYVNGVKRVESDGLTVRWWDRSAMVASKTKRAARGSEVLAQAVEKKLRRDPYLDGAQLDVVVDTKGLATLSGVVESLIGKRQAGWLAGSTVGVRQIRNHLKVRPKPPVSDAQVTKNVREALRRDPWVSSYEVSPSVRDGVVRLFGNVDTAYERSHAESVVARLSGVVDVRNLIVVTPPPQLPSAGDFELKQEIEQELFWSPFIDSDKVKVTVRNGVATLQGVVNNNAEKLAAENNAREAGARIVNNDLRLRGS